MVRCCIISSLLVAAVASTVTAQNQPPVVNAGKDTTVGIGYDYRMSARVTDDGLPAGTLDYSWSQVSGPDSGLTLSSMTSTMARVTFTGLGTFVLVLTATDGELTARDTIVFTVREALPFLVLTPAEGASVVVGSTVPISWQMDPVSSVNINLSTDGGLTFEYLKGPVIPQGTSATWQWDVSDTLPAGAQCQIQIQYYNEHNRIAVSGVFTLTPSTVRNGIYRARGADPGGVCETYTVQGRRISSVAAPARSLTRGVVLRRTWKEEGRLRGIDPAVVQ